MNQKARPLLLLLAITLLAAAFLLILSTPSEAATIVVDEGGEGNYTEFHHAAQAAQEGDEILVRAGEYQLASSLNFKNNVTVRGEGVDRTRLVFDLPSGGCYVSGKRLGFRDVNISSPWPENANGFRFYPGFWNLRVSNCSFSNLGDGFYIYMPPEGFLFENNQFWSTVFEPYYLDVYDTPANASAEGNTVNGGPLDFLVSRQDVTVGPGSRGVVLVNCSDIRISGIYLDGESQGIRLAKSSNILVRDCQFTAGGWDLLYVSRCRELTFRNCQFRATALERFGREEFLYFHENQGVRLVDCQFTDCGVLMEEDKGDRVTRCAFTGEHGIRLEDSRDGMLEGNSFESTGIIIQGSASSWDRADLSWAYHDIHNNSLGGVPILYYRNQSGVRLEGGGGQAFLVGCDNITVEGFQGSGSLSSLQLLDCEFGRVQNSSFMGVGSVFFISHSRELELWNCSIRDEGLYLSDSRDCLVTQSSFNCPTNTALFLRRAENITVAGNLFLNNSRGVTLDRAHLNRLELNSFDGNDVGVFISDSGNNSIARNDISGSDQGVYLGSESWHSKINNNDIHNNRVGVLITTEAGNNDICYNNIQDNELFGLQVDWVLDRTPPAPNNWWGHSSGPFHLDQNPGGYGNEASWSANVEPWLRSPVKVATGHDPGAGSGGSGGGFGAMAWLLAFLSLALFLSIVAVSRIPDEHFGRRAGAGRRRKKDEEPPELPRMPTVARNQERGPERAVTISESTTDPSQNISACPHCGGRFELSTTRRPIHFICHFCQKEIVLE